jgi:hypothetical protein
MVSTISLLRGRQAAIAMGFCTGQAGTELTPFAGLRAACGTTNRQRFFLRDFHAYTMHGSSPERWSIMTILQSLERSMISIARVQGSSGSSGAMRLPIARLSHSDSVSGAIHVQ